MLGCHRLYPHPTRSDGHYLCSFGNRKLVFGVTYVVDFNAFWVNERKYSRHIAAPFRLDRLRGAVALNNRAWRQMADTPRYALACSYSRSINAHDKQNSWRTAAPQQRSGCPTFSQLVHEKVLAFASLPCLYSSGVVAKGSVGAFHWGRNIKSVRKRIEWLTSPLRCKIWYPYCKGGR